MKEVHAYRNEDGTYKLEIVGEYCVNGELFEARVIYEKAKINSDGLTFSLPLAITTEDGDHYVTI